MFSSEGCKWINIRYSTQWIAALAGFFVLLQRGLHNGWTSPNIVRLTDVNSEILLTKEQISWLVSCPNLSQLAGVFFGLISNEYLGSKNTAILVLVLFSFNWTCLILANSVEWIFTARIISGAASGMTDFYFPIHLGDISAPKIRGTLIAVASSSPPIGLIISTVAEKYLTMRVSSSIYLTQCLLIILVFLWLKGSPYELARNGNFEFAKISIAFYNPDADIEKELNDVRDFVKLHKCCNLKDKLKAFKIPSLRKSLVVIFILYSLPLLSGILNIVSYMESILIKAKLKIIKPGDLVIYTYIIRILSGFSTVTLIDVLGRRIVLIISSIGTAAGMAGFGLHFYLLDHNYNAESLQWLPIISLLLYFILYSSGYVVVPNAIISELFPTSTKTTVTFLNTIWSSLLAFGITKAFQPLIDSIGEMYVFWIHAVFSLLTIPYVLFLLPETKGKSFQEIQYDLNKK